MSDRIEFMKDRYGKFAEGDVEGATQHWADDFVWRSVASEALPGGGEHRGKGAALEALGATVASWDTFDLHPEEYLEAGDTVVVIGYNEATKDGRTSRQPFAHVWHWRGDEMADFTVFGDSLQTKELLGL